MAKNKGLTPSVPKEISMQRKQLKAMMESTLLACTEPDMEIGTSFRAHAIITNSPAYGCTHVAEALGVPLHYAMDQLDDPKKTIDIILEVLKDT